MDPVPLADHWLTKEEYAGLSKDTLGMVGAATEILARLASDIHCLRETNKQLDDLRNAPSVEQMTDAQVQQLQRHFTELQRDHGMLVSKYEEFRKTNETMQGVIEALREDRSKLLEETERLNNQKRLKQQEQSQMAFIGAEYVSNQRDRESLYKAQQDDIARKINECNKCSQQVLELVEHTNMLAKELDALDNERIPLETHNATLLQNSHIQSQNKQYLQKEILLKDEELREKTQSLLALKKDMSGTMLDLQQKIAILNEEVTNSHLNIQREQEMIDTQNRWLAEELRQRTAELLFERQSRTEESAKYKKSIVLLREKNVRMQNNVDVLKQKISLLHADLRRLQQQQELNQTELLRRKDYTSKELAQQGTLVSTVVMQLQNANEDLLVLKSKLCQDCRSRIKIFSERKD